MKATATVLMMLLAASTVADAASGSMFNKLIVNCKKKCSRTKRRRRARCIRIHEMGTDRQTCLTAADVNHNNCVDTCTNVMTACTPDCIELKRDCLDLCKETYPFPGTLDRKTCQLECHVESRKDVNACFLSCLNYEYVCP